MDRYDAGFLNDFGGGDVSWWQDYLRAELERAHDFYDSQLATLTAENAALKAADRTLKKNGYTYTAGAELWKPPLGSSAAPLLDKIDSLTTENAALNAKVERLERSNQWNDSQRCAWLKECLDTSRELDQLKAQLSAAVQAEREACAQEVEHWGKIQKREGGVSVWTDYVAAAIRGRANDPVKAQLAAAEPFDAEAVQRIIIDYCSDKMMAEHCRAMGEEIIDLFHTSPPQHAADKPWIALAATMYQAAGAFDMPVRVLDLLSTAQCDMPFAHLIDGVLPVMPEQHAARVPEWQPIETAPKDCAFLGYYALHSDLWVIAPMYWSDPEFLILQFHSDNSEHSCKPTHWMPIPAAPTPPALEKASGFCDNCERTPDGIRLCQQCESNCRIGTTPPAQEG